MEMASILRLACSTRSAGRKDAQGAVPTMSLAGQPQIWRGIPSDPEIVEYPRRVGSTECVHGRTKIENRLLYMWFFDNADVVLSTPADAYT